jgi:serralysin
MSTLTNPANDQDIDGLLWGWQWTPNQINGHTQLYYSFPTSTVAYGYTVWGFEAFNTAQQAAANRAIANADAVSNVDLAFTANEAAGNIRFAEADGFSFPGYTWDPHNGSPQAFGLAPDDFAVALAAQGDTWFTHTYYNTPTPGSFAYACGILHEMGHALGLKHGQDSQPVHAADGTVLYTNPALPAAHDGIEYSVMTYRAYPGAPLTLSLPDEGPSTLMQDDIYALQWMYGANYEHNSGNTAYSWNNVTGEMSIDGAGQGAAFRNKILMTVWDGGGVDTYDFSNFATPVTADLRPGGWSTPSRAMLADLDWHNEVTHLAGGCIANALAFPGDDRCYIENAWGGSGNDSLTGNLLRNTLRGNGGNDTLNGGAGSDVLVGGLGNDSYVLGGESTGVDVVSDIGGAADRILSMITRSLAPYRAIEQLTLTGFAAISGVGNGLGNVLVGNGAANTLNGALGNDRLVGLGGNDVLIGGAGRDISTGGIGNDIFRFASASQSSPGSADAITDFDDFGNDRIDLRSAYGGRLGYIHNAHFTGAGQVRINDVPGSAVVVEVNIGGTLDADMQIRLTNTTLKSMTSSDFLL